MKPSTYYFHMKTKILAHLQICICVPLRAFMEQSFSIDFKIFISFSGVSMHRRQPYMEFGRSSFLLAEKLNLVGLIGRGYKICLKEFRREIASQSSRLNLGQPFLCIFGFLCCFSRTESTRFPLLDYRSLSKTFAYIGACFSRIIWRGLE